MIIINITYKVSAKYKRLFDKRLNRIEMADELAFYIEQHNETKSLSDFKMQTALNYDNKIEIVIQSGPKDNIFNIVDINKIDDVNFKELMRK